MTRWGSLRRRRTVVEDEVEMRFVSYFHLACALPGEEARYDSHSERCVQPSEDWHRGFLGVQQGGSVQACRRTGLRDRVRSR